MSARGLARSPARRSRTSALGEGRLAGGTLQQAPSAKHHSLGRQEDLMKRVLTAALAATALLLGGCANDNSGTQPPPAPSASTAYPVTVGNVTLDKRPERI